MVKVVAAEFNEIVGHPPPEWPIGQPRERLPNWLDHHLRIDYRMLPLVKRFLALLASSSAHPGLVLFFRLFEIRRASGEALVETIARFDRQLADLRRHSDPETDAFTRHSLGTLFYYGIVEPYKGPGQELFREVRTSHHQQPLPNYDAVRAHVDTILRTNIGVFKGDDKLFRGQGAEEVRRQHVGAFDRLRPSTKKSQPKGKQGDPKKQPTSDGEPQANAAFAWAAGLPRPSRASRP